MTRSLMPKVVWDYTTGKEKIRIMDHMVWHVLSLDNDGNIVDISLFRRKEDVLASINISWSRVDPEDKPDVHVEMYKIIATHETGRVEAKLMPILDDPEHL